MRLQNFEVISEKLNIDRICVEVGLEKPLVVVVVVVVVVAVAVVRVILLIMAIVL